MPSDPPLFGSILLQIVLILINAFFAMTEIAAISINDNKLHRMAEDGDKRARSLEALLASPSRFLSTIQVGITMAGFLGSAFAADSFSGLIVENLLALGLTIQPSLLNTISVVAITLILSYFTLVFGELVPKRIAQRNPEKIALAVAGVISGIATVTRPVVWLLTASTNAILRMIGINPDDPEEDVTEEEIRLLVDVGGEKGTIDETERQMIDNVFEFNDTTAEELMTHRTDVVAFWVDDGDDEIRETIRESGLSRFPVYDEDIDDIIGVLNTRDYLLNLIAPEKKDLRALLRQPYFVPLHVAANVLFRDMQREKIHMAIVVDEYGGTNGIVTMEDLVEEIVGNIYDEYDPAEDLIRDLGDGVYRLSGSLNIDDLSDMLHIELPTDEFDTLSGLIFGQLSSIPEDGSRPHVLVAGLDIQVEEIEDRRVVWATVQREAPADAGDASDAKSETRSHDRRS